MIQTTLKLNPENQQTYKKLLVNIKVGQGGLCLLIAVCDNPLLRERIINQYEQDLPDQIRPYRVKLDRDEPSLRGAIAQLVESEEYLKNQGKAVITATGTDELLNISFKGERTTQDKFFGYLQWTREGLMRFKYPIVLWIDYQILNEMVFKAPDFWSWRSGVFTFVTEESMIIKPDHHIQGIDFRMTEEHNEDDFLALEDLEELIASIESKEGDKNPYLGTLYDRLGQVYQNRIRQGKADNECAEREKAKACFNKAIRLQSELGFRADLVNTLIHLSLFYDFHSQYKEVIKCCEQALEIAKEIGDRHGEAYSYNNLGNVYDSLEEYQKAITFYQQSLDITKKIGDRNGEARSYGNLGNAYYSLGEYQRAIAFYQQSLDICREIGDRSGEANTLFNIGNVLKELGQHSEAITNYEKARKLYQEMGLEQDVRNCDNQIELCKGDINLS